uniref:Uncharacterized protein n=1 Tax=Takifugu rubripes TaxID=31033 RepID=A0A3B5KBW0_TAKRU
FHNCSAILLWVTPAATMSYCLMNGVGFIFLIFITSQRRRSRLQHLAVHEISSMSSTQIPAIFLKRRGRNVNEHPRQDADNNSLNKTA